MRQSECFTKSEGRFGCTSCHDPHRSPAPAEKIRFYEDRCRACHVDSSKAAQKPVSTASPDCSLPAAERAARAPREHCLTCHMPRQASSVAAGHLAVTDHRVLRRPDRPSPVAAGALEKGHDGIPLVSFHRHLLDAKDEEWPRDLGVGVMPLVAQTHDDGALQVSGYLSRRAVPLLEKAVARAPDDVAALEALGYGLFARGDGATWALQALDNALKLAPNREQTLTWAAHIAQAEGRHDQAATYARRLTEKYPYYAEHHERLAGIHVSREDWPRALQAVRKALQLDPFRGAAREILIEIHLATGDRARAQAEFDALGVIDAEWQQRIQPWFAKRFKSE
jgi:tetratricopeptide (TPR) repeat protein